jgi:dTDP-4-amino-4,6-dideoxygalactose transaminase
MTAVSIADPQVSSSAVDRVMRVLDDGQLADGPVVRSFEDAFTEYVGVDNGVATANGTAALHAALNALGIGEGDAVVTTPFSFVASANAVRLCGATPVFADIDPDTYNLDPACVRAALDGRDDVAAVLAVHLYGLPADVEALREIADRHDVALVEDAAQAHGAAYEGDQVGSFGDVAAFSFYPTKNMTTGEGGMVVTDSGTIADRAARFVDHGREAVAGAPRYRHSEVGHNFRMSSIAAAIGLSQLERLPERNAQRREHAARLTEALSAIPRLTTPMEPEGHRHVYNQYTVSLEERNGLGNFLDERGVDTAVYYPRAINEQPAFSDASSPVPVAERMAREVVSLPVHPNLSEEQLDHVIASVQEYYGYD